MKITKIPAVAAEMTGTPESGVMGMILTFADGDKLEIASDLFSHAITTMATMHGLKQKLVDAAALSRDPDTGRSATVADKKAAVMEVYDRLMAGHWNKPREGAGSVKGGLLFAALCRMQPGKPAEEIKLWLDEKSDEQKAALRKNPKIAAIIAEIQSERAKSGDVDTDAMLDELNG